MKYVKIVIIVVLIMFVFGCDQTPTADQQQAEVTQLSMQEAQRQVGMPGIVNFRERRLMKQILELRDQEDLICYAYTFSEVTGKFTYMGRCLGYGLPYSVQYTNPMRREYSTITLPQPDPNGLFMPDGLSATWVLMLDKNGDPRPEYFEPLLSVSQFPKDDRIVTNPEMNPDTY